MAIPSREALVSASGTPLQQSPLGQVVDRRHPDQLGEPVGKPCPGHARNGGQGLDCARKDRELFTLSVEKISEWTPGLCIWGFFEAAR